MATLIKARHSVVRAVNHRNNRTDRQIDGQTDSLLNSLHSPRRCVASRRVDHLYSHKFGSVFVDEGAESQAVSEGRRHVGDGHVPVALTLKPAPLLQCFDGGHPEAASPNSSAAERLSLALLPALLPALRGHAGESFPRSVDELEVTERRAWACVCVYGSVCGCVRMSSRPVLD